MVQYTHMLSCVILTKNEEKKIRQCIQSVLFANEILIIDDYSIDKTPKIAQKFTSHIYHYPVSKDFSKARNFGVSKCKYDWILMIDADETLDKTLQKQIQHVVQKNIGSSYFLKRKDIFHNKKLKWGEVRTLYTRGIIRLFKKSSGQFEGQVHEEFKPLKKPHTLNGYILHHPHSSIEDFLKSINSYSTSRADELYNKKIKPKSYEIIFYPIIKFIYTYFIKLGILDGWEGFVYSFMMSFHSFLVKAKLYTKYL